jgi:hypothetical protein
MEERVGRYVEYKLGNEDEERGRPKFGKGNVKTLEAESLTKNHIAYSKVQGIKS